MKMKSASAVISALVFWTSLAMGAQVGDSLTVLRGQLTFDVLGVDDPSSPSFSRNLHFPGGTAGVTIGRGYDLSEMNESLLEFELRRAKVNLPQRKILRNAIGLTNAAAEAFVLSNSLEFGTISSCAQSRLFDMKVAQELNSLAQEFNADLEQLDPILIDVLLDISWFKDVTAESRPIISSLIGDNDLQLAFETMSDETLWVDNLHIPIERFTRRKDYMSQHCSENLCSCPTAVCSFSCCDSLAAKFLDVAFTEGGTREDTSTYEQQMVLTNTAGLSYNLNALLIARDEGYIDLGDASHLISSISCAADGTAVSIDFTESVPASDVTLMFPVDSVVMILGVDFSTCMQGNNTFIIVQTASASGPNTVDVRGQKGTFVDLMSSGSFQLRRLPISRRRNRRLGFFSDRWADVTQFASDTVDAVGDAVDAVGDAASDALDAVNEILVETFDDMDLPSIPATLEEDVSFLNGWIVVELRGSAAIDISIENLSIDWTISGGFKVRADIRTGGSVNLGLTPQFVQLSGEAGDSLKIMDVPLSDFLSVFPEPSVQAIAKTMKATNIDMAVEYHVFFKAGYEFSHQLAIDIGYTYTLPETLYHIKATATIPATWPPIQVTTTEVREASEETTFDVPTDPVATMSLSGYFVLGIDPKVVVSLTPFVNLELSNEIGPGIRAEIQGTPFPPRERNGSLPVDVNPPSCSDCHHLYLGLYLYLNLLQAKATLDVSDILDFLDPYEKEWNFGEHITVDGDLVRYCGLKPSDPDQYACQCPPPYENMCLQTNTDSLGVCTISEMVCPGGSSCDQQTGICVPDPVPDPPAPAPEDPVPPPEDPPAPAPEDPVPPPEDPPAPPPEDPPAPTPEDPVPPPEDPPAPTPEDPPAPTPEDPPVDPQYVGCFDDQWQRDLEVGLFFDRSIDDCIAACLDLDYSYAGLQMGNECFCSNNYGIYGESTECTMTCDGRPCGGFGANSVYRTYSTSTSSSMSMSDASYCGCWQDRDVSTPYRALGNYMGGGYTDQGCIRTCEHRGFALAGIQEDGPGLGGACYCDNELARGSTVMTTCTTGDVTGNGGDPQGLASCDVHSPSKICWNDANPCHWCGNLANGLFATNPGVVCPS